MDSPMEQKDFIGLSILLTDLVYRTHQQIAVIGCLNPSSISIQRDLKKAHLSGNMEWNEVYQSPEQTGRVNRVADGRSDLYTLGLLFYEMLTGQLPFLPEDGEEWAAAHVQMAPLPLSEIRREWDGPLQAILLKLLAKSPDERYQSAYGLLDDLKHCEEMLEKSGELTSFEIGRIDTIRSFHLTDSLYGCSAAIEQMQAGLQQAANGLPVFRWISGVEGSGKTSLVQKLYPDIVARGGRFIEGRGKQFPSIKPFEPLLQALRQWIHQLWSEPDDEITRLKGRLHAECGQETQTIVSVLPEAKSLFISQVDETLAPDADAWRRFGELLPLLIRCFANSKPPLVMFMDDLQRADENTHAVIRALLLGEPIPGLFLIGAFQTELDCGVDDNDRNFTLKFPWLADRIRTFAAEQVVIHPLHFADIRQYVTDTIHEDSARVRLLARLLYHETGGNPRAIRLLLEGWVLEKKLLFDDKQRQWIWDAEIVRQLSDVKANPDLMEKGFTLLPVETKMLLAMAAAIGSTFHLSLLSEVSNYATEVTLGFLHDAEVQGIVYWEEELRTKDVHERVYMFGHDHLHQLAYSCDTDRNSQRHQKIGRLLQRRQSEGDDTLLEMVDHLNRGVASMSVQEMEQLAEYNLQVAMNAMDDGHYWKGKPYIEAGLQLIVEEEEIQSGSQFFRLKQAYVWFEYMSGNKESAKQLLLDMDKRGGKLNRVDRSQLWEELIHFHALDENEISIRYGKEALAAYGWKVRGKVSKLSIVKEVIHTRLFLHQMQDQLHAITSSHDVEHAALCRYVELLFYPLLVHNPEALVDLYARFIRYGVRKGLNESLIGIIWSYELLLQRVSRRYVQAEFLFDRESIGASVFAGAKLQHRLAYTRGLSKQLEHPVEASIYMGQALHYAVELGDKSFANIVMISCLITHNRDLYVLSDLLDYFEAHMRPYASDKTLELVQIAGSYLAALQDESLQADFITIPVPHSEDRARDSEDNFSFICKLEVAYLSGKYREALYWAKRGRENELALDWGRIWKHRLYEALALAAVYPEVDAVERKRIRQAIRRQLRLMKKRKGYLGADSSAYLLMKAEWTRIEGDEWGALRGYTEAVKRARVEKYGLMEGISSERLASYYQNDMHSRSGAIIAAMDACTAYSIWGITSKVTLIRHEHADLFRYITKTYGGQIHEELKGKADRELQLPHPHVAGHMRASANGDELLQQILDWQGWTNKADWPISFLKVAIRQAGADRGAVLRCRNNGFDIASSLGGHADEEVADGYAVSVLRHTVMTNEPILLQDALHSHFLQDTYIQEQRPRSILCLPVRVPGERSAALLYLENRHLSGVFTERDLNVLQLLATRIIYFNVLEDEAAAASAEDARSLASSLAPGTAQSSLVEPLTGREVEILTAIAEGLSNRDIANRFGIAETTVKTHTSRIFGKLGAKRRGQAVVRAKELQLID
ncbi:AAA family ATPase [Paenibacillus taichungensis]|uniref:AAA family ATPase n=1 Tax=Paenibacillus taichungensis TaxID=484184 RepID=UPI0039A62B7A